MVFAARRDRLQDEGRPRRQRRRASHAPGSGLRRLLVFCVIVVLVVLAAPYIIAPFYRVIDPVSTPMLWRWATGQRVQRIFVPLGRIAPVVPPTVILAEDASFCRNHGIDLGAIREVLQQSDDDVAESRGGFDHHPANGQKPVPLARAQRRSQGVGNAAGYLADIGTAEATDHGNLSQYRPNGVRMGSSALRQARAGRSASRRATSTPGRRLN